MTARSNPLPLDANAPMVEMRNVNKWYGKFQALKNVSLMVRKGERVVICGPSSKRCTPPRSFLLLPTCAKRCWVISATLPTSSPMHVGWCFQE